MKVVFCIPTLTRPYKACLESLKASVPIIEKAGWEHAMVSEIGCPYISSARATMLRKALEAQADVIVFIDHDLSWKPSDLLKLIETKGDVVAGLYRFKKDEEHYMGVIDDLDGIPQVRDDGAIKATRVPAGFMKITREAVEKFIASYPNLTFGPMAVDLFNHGAYAGAWWGEDYAFCRNWESIGGDIWIVPDLDLCHHSDDNSYVGNFHEFMMKQPGGSSDPERKST